MIRMSRLNAYDLMDGRRKKAHDARARRSLGDDVFQAKKQADDALFRSGNTLYPFEDEAMIVGRCARGYVLEVCEFMCLDPQQYSYS